MHTPPLQPVLLILTLAVVSACGPKPAATTEAVKEQAGPSARDFAVVRDGVAGTVVVLPADATPRNREAAQELVAAIEKMSGGKLEVVEVTPENAPARAIWIGMHPGLEALFPGFDLELSRPEEIRIVSTENHLLIAGRDVYDPQHMSVQGTHEPIPGFQNEYGTANAVYSFLQDQLGVRWLLPGPLGPDFPESRDITVPATDVRYSPQFRARMGIFYQLDLGQRLKGEIREWARRQRMLLDSLDAEGGHGFTDWWEKFGESRPELFALMPDGTRGSYPEKPELKKLCDGEPAVAGVWIGEVAKQLEANPNQRIFNVAANDNWSSGICQDPRSLALDPAIEAGTPTFTITYGPNGPSREFPPLIDRYVHFANSLARKLREHYPDRELFVAQAAYGDVGRMPPVNVKPNDNVLILAVHNFLFRGRAEREEQRQHLSGWGKIHDNIIWRPNTGAVAGWHWGTPEVPFTQVAEDFRFAADNGVVGIFIDTVWQHWSTTGPLYYLMAQLAWNPRADAGAIMEDYCARAYGPAAGTLLEYWRLLEKTRNDLTAASPSRWRMMDSPQFYTDEFFKMAFGLLDRAAKETEGAKSVYAERVAFVRHGMDYTRHVIGIRAAMERWENSGKQDEEAKAAVLAGWQETEQFRRTFPEFAIAWERVFRNDVPVAGQRRMLGLHPEAVLTPKFLAEWKASKAGSHGVQDELE